MLPCSQPLAYYQEQIFIQPTVIYVLNYLANKLLKSFLSHTSTPFKSYRRSAGVIINNADVSICKKKKKREHEEHN